MNDISQRWKAIILTVMVAIIPMTYVAASQLQSTYHGIGLLKSATSFASPGDTVVYEIRVYNPSDFDLFNVTVIDDMLGFNATIPVIAMGNTTGVTYTLTRVVQENDTSPLINTVTATAVDAEALIATTSTQARTTIIQRWIDIEKSGPTYAHEGDVVQLTITIENTANATLHDVLVKDEALGFGWQGDLAIDEINRINLTYVIPPDAPDPLTNLVTASAELNGAEIYAEDAWTIDILHPAIDVDKMVEPATVSTGSNATFTIITTNTGDTTLYDVTLVDSLQGTVTPGTVQSPLQPGDYFVWTYNATIDDDIRNTATVSGIDALGRNVSDMDSVGVQVTPHITVNIEPDTLNFRSRGSWITAYLNLTGLYDSHEVAGESLRLWYGDASLPPERWDAHDATLIAKFSRQHLIELLADVLGDVELTVTGEYAGEAFQGHDRIRVINPE
jgi:uncharacterized repeat protein (TIGR01451 family)